MRLVNLPMRRILALPFPTPLSKSLMLLCITGRRGGRSYRQPVSYVKDGDSLLTPGGNWKLNLEPGRIGSCLSQLRRRAPGSSDPHRYGSKDHFPGAWLFKDRHSLHTGPP